MMKQILRISTVLIAAAIIVPLLSAGVKRIFVTIGTGGVTGVYYPVGGAIAKMVNKKRAEYGIRASVESTGGSVYNINAVLSGDLEFGVAQSDRQYQAWNGLAEWEGAPQKKLRAVFSLHPEVVTLVASEESGIRSVDDLAGKRVNIGNPGSGHRGNAVEILEAKGIRVDEDLHAESLSAPESPKFLQDGRIDAFFYTVGHPNGAIKESTSGKRRVRIVPITGLEALIEQRPYYASSLIPHKYYPQALGSEDIESIGVVTTFVTSSDVSDDVVYAVTKEIASNLDAFRKLHPALEGMTLKSMLKGLSAPLHSGAERYFREIGAL